MRIIFNVALVIVFLAIAMFLGKTTIDIQEGIYKMERPLTALFFLLMVIFGLLEK